MRGASQRAPQRPATGTGKRQPRRAEADAPLPPPATQRSWLSAAAALLGLALVAAALLHHTPSLRGSGEAPAEATLPFPLPQPLPPQQAALPPQQAALPPPAPHPVGAPAPAPSPLPPNDCADFQDSLASSTTLLQQVTVQGVTPSLQLYLLAHAPEAPLEIEAAMTRTEAMMAAAYKKILLDPYWAARPGPAASAVIEVGVHGGWFTTLAHKFGGHRVVGFDMQPYCVLVARCALQVNSAGGASVILNRFVSHGEATVDVSSSSCGGGLGVGNRARGEVSVRPVHLARYFAESAASLGLAADFEVPLLKSDTEGFEGVVLETALPMLGRIHNVLLEVFAPRWKMHGIDEARALAVFECLHAAGMDEMVDLPRRDIDFIAPGDIDLDNVPPERVHRTWEAWRTQIGYILAEKNGLINPNVWLRWGSQERRRALDLAKVPQCQASLAQNSYTAPA